MPFAWFWPVVARIVVDILCPLHGFGPVVVTIVRDVLCPLHGLGQAYLCRMSDAICMVLVRSEEVESVLPHGVHEFVVAGAKPLYATRRALALERGTPLCRMPFAWFWQVVARIVVDIICHLHGFGQVVVTIVQDALFHLHGFGESWLELCRMPYAICMVLVSRA